MGPARLRLHSGAWRALSFFSPLASADLFSPPFRTTLTPTPLLLSFPLLSATPLLAATATGASDQESSGSLSSKLTLVVFALAIVLGARQRGLITAF